MAEAKRIIPVGLVLCLVAPSAWAEGEASTPPKTQAKAPPNAPAGDPAAAPGTPGSTIDPLEATPPRPPTAAEVRAAGEGRAQAAKALMREIEYYRRGMKSFAADMQNMVRLLYQGQRDRLAGQYERAVVAREEVERRRRKEAIERFEAFLRKYPGEPEYTPDAMFRLAELYFERSSDAYLLATRKYEDDLVAFEAGKLGAEPSPPKPDYRETVAMHKSLLERFPRYRLADAAQYLLGYAYAEEARPEQALLAFQGLVKNYPKSRFAPEVWTRIGEIYFERNDPASLRQAIAAYRQVRAFPNSPYYDKALYKVAWTHYRLDQFGAAVQAFIELVAYADRKQKETGVTGSELRAEAIQYVAISLADEDWGGMERARSILDPLKSKSYTPELWKRYGEILFDQTRYRDAIRVLAYGVRTYPNSATNPAAQAKIVTAYERLREFEEATAAREQLVDNYSKGGRWHSVNAQNVDALKEAHELTENSLYRAAIFRHQQAQAHKKAGREAAALAAYRAAAEAYRAYLSRFSGSKNAYDFEYFLAECLYYSGQYVAAADVYGKVRDSTKENRHLAAAALSTVISYEKAIARAEAAGKLPARPLRRAKEREDEPVRPKPIEALRQKLVDASDRYVKLLPASKRSPAVAYRAAEIFFKHDEMEKARERFHQIVSAYPHHQVAQYSSNLIIESYLAAKDWGNVESWSGKLIAVAEKGPSSEARGKLIDNLRRFKVGAQFKQAEAYDAKGDYEKAGEAYVRLVDENPQHEFADKALFNAALAFEKVKRFESASSTYQRLYKVYPKSSLAPRSLFRVGVNAEKSFDFKSAVSAYELLVDRYPNSEHRADALYNVAATLENMQQYDKAATAFERYATTFSKRPDAAEMQLRGALAYEKAGAPRKLVDSLSAFIRRYWKDRAQAEKVVHALRRKGDGLKTLGKQKRMVDAYEACIKTFDARKLPLTSRAGRDAAQCSFELAEERFRGYDALAISGSGRKLVASLKRKAKRQRWVEQAYKRVFRFKRAETTLAALFRIGHSYERFSEALIAAPVPKEIAKNEEYVMEYRSQLEEKAAVLGRKAEGAYRKAHEEARRTRVTNRWTRKTLESLNKYAPDDFPLQKPGKPLLQPYMLTAHGFQSGDPVAARGKEDAGARARDEGALRVPPPKGALAGSGAEARSGEP